MSCEDDAKKDFAALVVSLSRSGVLSAEMRRILASEMNTSVSDVDRIVAEAGAFWEEEIVEFDPAIYPLVRAYDDDENDSLLCGPYTCGPLKMLVYAMRVFNGAQGEQVALLKACAPDHSGRSNSDRLFALRSLVSDDDATRPAAFKTVKLKGYKGRYVLWMEPEVHYD